MSDALIVFAKVPEPGRVKTRLCPPLAPEAAARLYEAMLLDALAAYRTLDVDGAAPALRLYLGSDPATPVPPALLDAAGGRVFWQAGEGLGERLLRAFAETFHAGFERVVVVGTDHPTLPPVFLEVAFAELETPQTVTIGPTEDGGYAFLGLRNVVPDLFLGLAFSHPAVAETTIQRALAAGCAVTALPDWYDVDDAEGLARLRADLAADPDLDAPRTRAALATMPPAR